MTNATYSIRTLVIVVPIFVAIFLVTGTYLLNIKKRECYHGYMAADGEFSYNALILSGCEKRLVGGPTEKRFYCVVDEKLGDAIIDVYVEQSWKYIDEKKCPELVVLAGLNGKVVATHYKDLDRCTVAKLMSNKQRTQLAGSKNSSEDPSHENAIQAD